MPKKVYIVQMCERHGGDEITVCTNKKRAVRIAKDFVHKVVSWNPIFYKKYPPKVEEIDGWVYYCKITDDGDNVRVLEGELDTRNE